MKTKYYLAYGSNLNIRQMRRRCPTAKVYGTAEIPDYQLLFKGSRTGAYLTIEENEGSSVPVGVWEVTESDEEALDRYEGYPRFYYKKEITIKCRRKETNRLKTVKAFVYIMHESHKLDKPTPSYVDTCLEGYLAFGFEEEPLVRALNLSEGEKYDEDYGY